MAFTEAIAIWREDARLDELEAQLAALEASQAEHDIAIAALQGSHFDATPSRGERDALEAALEQAKRTADVVVRGRPSAARHECAPGDPLCAQPLE
jgi:hypothetical protein